MEQVQYAQLLGVTLDNLSSYMGETHWLDNNIFMLNYCKQSVLSLSFSSAGKGQFLTGISGVSLSFEVGGFSW